LLSAFNCKADPIRSFRDEVAGTSNANARTERHDANEMEFMRYIATVENASSVPVVTIAPGGSEAREVRMLPAGTRAGMRKLFVPNPVKKHVFRLLESKP